MTDKDPDTDMTDAVLEAQSQGLSGWRQGLSNYREILALDNGLVWLLDLLSIAIGYAIITDVGGPAGWIIGGLLFGAGAVGILDSLYGRVMG